MIQASHTEIKIITSAKGGVGKSTVCANLGMALALRGFRVLLIDCDTANRCLDLMLGMEDCAIYGIRDVLADVCPIEKAILSHPQQSNLHLLAGCSADAAWNADLLHALPSLVKSLSEDTSDQRFDYVLIDTPGGMLDVLSTVASCADEALIVSSPQATAIRSAEKTATLLVQQHIEKQRLIVNSFPAGNALFKNPKTASSIGRKLHNKQKKAAIDSLFHVIDTISLTLLGVVPFDETIWDKQNSGILINDPACSSQPFSHAFYNMAARLCHKNVPLFTYDKSDRPQK
ncbi:MAG: P-loop NTPase [Clostridia bacterium]|nr:P-loop NTPase [Clostridia bacterium]